MSTSKNVETCTALSTDARRLLRDDLADVRHRLDRLVAARRARSAPTAWSRSAPARRGRGGRGGRGRGRRGRPAPERPRPVRAPPPRNTSTSRLVTRPPRPVPGICAMSSPCSATMRATTGDMNECRSRLSPLASAAGAGAARRGRADDRHRLEVRRVGGGGRRDVGRPAAARAPAPDRRPGPGAVGRRGGAAGGRSAGAAERGAGGRRAAARVDHGDARAHVDGLALGHEQLADGAGRGRGDLGVDLVGRDLDDRLVRLHGLADLLAPGDDRALGHADSHLRHDDIDERSGTHGFLPAISRRTACGRRPGRRRPAG